MIFFTRWYKLSYYKMYLDDIRFVFYLHGYFDFAIYIVRVSYTIQAKKLVKLFLRCILAIVSSAFELYSWKFNVLNFVSIVTRIKKNVSPKKPKISSRQTEMAYVLKNLWNWRKKLKVYLQGKYTFARNARYRIYLNIL